MRNYAKRIILDNNIERLLERIAVALERNKTINVNAKIKSYYPYYPYCPYALTNTVRFASLLTTNNIETMTKVKMTKRDAIDLSRVLKSVKPTLRGAEIIYNKNKKILDELFKSFEKDFDFPKELKEYEKQHNEITEKAGKLYLEESSKKVTKAQEKKLKDLRETTNKQLDDLTAKNKDKIDAYRKHEAKILDQEVEFELETMDENDLPAGIKEEHIQYVKPMLNK